MNLNHTRGKLGIAILTKRSLENKQHTVCNWGQPQRDFWQHLQTLNTQVKTRFPKHSLSEGEG